MVNVVCLKECSVFVILLKIYGNKYSKNLQLFLTRQNMGVIF